MFEVIGLPQTMHFGVDGISLTIKYILDASDILYWSTNDVYVNISDFTYAKSFSFRNSLKYVVGNLSMRSIKNAFKSVI